MPLPSSEKLETLFKMLAREPADPFLLYGIGMEYKKLGAADEAIAHFDRTTAADPNYCYAYYQRGQVCEAAGRSGEARAAYEAGIVAADRIGDAHAASELRGALSMIE